MRSKVRERPALEAVPEDMPSNGSPVVACPPASSEVRRRHLAHGVAHQLATGRGGPLVLSAPAGRPRRFHEAWFVHHEALFWRLDQLDGRARAEPA